ncbi:MAG TPA: head GIN domain-containing protein [Flavobacteriales bacterium]|nr:head GIN domain-containing protein [Flavobacteriales bacterium]
MRPTFILLSLTFLSLGACRMDCAVGTGPVEQRALDIGPFTGIEVGGAISVVIEKGSEQKVVARGQANLIDLLGTEVKSGIWKIRSPQCWRTSEPFEIHITTASQLASIDIGGSGDVRAANVFGSGRTKLAVHGSGSIQIDEINEKKIEVSISGSGTATLRGTCAVLDGSISGSGDLNGRELAANEASLKISGSGDATITAISKLTAKVSGSGTVRYAGKPDIESKVSGSGSVTPIE